MQTRAVSTLSVSGSTLAASRSLRGVSVACRTRPGSIVRQLRLQCAAGTSTIPLFPLNVVALPGVEGASFFNNIRIYGSKNNFVVASSPLSDCPSSVPLHIFEARYRVLFNTLLSGADDVEQELVDTESPYAGSRKFGMCFTTGRGTMASVGTLLEIERHERLQDGRMLVVSKGSERFKITKILKERPYIVAEVQDYEDAQDAPAPDDEYQTLAGLGDEVRTLFINTLMLSNKSKGVINPDPVELDDMDATGLSYWLASVFREAPLEQQNILEMPSARTRLQREQTILRDTLNYLSATVALKGALSDIDARASADDPPSGSSPSA